MNIVDDLKGLYSSPSNTIVDETPLGSCSIKKVSISVITNSGHENILNYKGIPKFFVIANQVTNEKVAFEVSTYDKHRLESNLISIDLKNGEKLKLAI